MTNLFTVLISGLKKKICIINYSIHSKKLNEEVDFTYLLKSYYSFCKKNSKVKYDVVSGIKIKECPEKHKYVGLQIREKEIYFVPNDRSEVMVFNFEDKKIKYFGDLSKDIFKWTGGAKYKGMLYFFPRKENEMLCVDGNNHISKIISNFKYTKEHHYSGVCTNDGIVFQPPRSENHILVWNLNTLQLNKINLAPRFLKIRYRYCGSVIHPNGYIYFIPEKNGKVIKMNQKTQKWSFIGSQKDIMVFDAKVAVDGNIYGFSAYCSGMLKIDVKSDSVEMIHQEICFGAYGTKIGINGNLYSIPGDGDTVWEYNVFEDKLRSLIKVENNNKAKWAGGCTYFDGTIIGTPAEASEILVIKPDYNELIPNELFNSFYYDNY